MSSHYSFPFHIKESSQQIKIFWKVCDIRRVIDDKGVRSWIEAKKGVEKGTLWPIFLDFRWQCYVRATPPGILTLDILPLRWFPPTLNPIYIPSIPSPPEFSLNFFFYPETSFIPSTGDSFSPKSFTLRVHICILIRNQSIVWNLQFRWFEFVL